MANLFEKLNFAVAREKVEFKEGENSHCESDVEMKPAERAQDQSSHLHVVVGEGTPTQVPRCFEVESELGLSELPPRETDRDSALGLSQPDKQNGCPTRLDDETILQQQPSAKKLEEILPSLSSTVSKESPVMPVSTTAANIQPNEKLEAESNILGNKNDKDTCTPLEQIVSKPSSRLSQEEGVNQPRLLSPEVISSSSDFEDRLSGSKMQSSSFPKDAKTMVHVADGTEANTPSEHSALQPAAANETLKKQVKHKTEQHRPKEAEPCTKRAKKAKSTSKGVTTDTRVKNRDGKGKAHGEMGAKITKAARRERNSGSADAKAAYLPLSKPFVIPRKKAKQGTHGIFSFTLTLPDAAQCIR